MGKAIKFTQTWNGLSNQPPVRKYPGQCSDILNRTLDIAVGSRTRNGTDLIATLPTIPSSLSATDLYVTSFREDIIFIWSGSLQVINGTTGAVKTVSDDTDADGYLAGANRSTIRTTNLGNSTVILNRSIVTATTTSDAYTIAGTKSKYSDLPTDAAVGEVWLVNFYDGVIPQGYYKRVALDNGTLTWQRVAAPNDQNAVPVGSTLPHRLLPDSTADYAYERIDWTPRRSGDDLLNPRMPWFGSTLDVIAEHAARLFLIGKGYVTSTSSDDRELLYINDIDASTAVTNPINVPFNSNAVGAALYASSINGELFIASEKGQLRFTANQEQLTNINGQAIGIGDRTTKAVPPALSLSNAVIVDEQLDLREFLPSQVGYLGDAGNLNAHALQILKDETPLQLYRFGGTLFIPCASGDVKVHEKTLDGNNLLQTGWTRYSFNAPDSTDNVVVYMDEWGDEHRLVVKTPTGFELWRYVHKAEYARSGFNIAPCFDRRQYITGTYQPHSDSTRFVYSGATENTRVYTSGSQGRELNVSSSTSTYIEVAGNVSGEVCVGTLYEDYEEYDELYFGPSSVKPTVLEMTLFYSGANGEVIMSRKGNAAGVAERRKKLTNLAAGADLISDSGIRFGSQTIFVGLNGTNALIRVEHSGAVPLTISGIEFQIG